jgi:hypothetical protein
MVGTVEPAHRAGRAPTGLDERRPGWTSAAHAVMLGMSEVFVELVRGVGQGHGGWRGRLRKKRSYAEDPTRTAFQMPHAKHSLIHTRIPACLDTSLMNSDCGRSLTLNIHSARATNQFRQCSCAYTNTAKTMSHGLWILEVLTLFFFYLVGISPSG